MKTKLISIIICLSMILSCTGSVFAAEGSSIKPCAGNSIGTATYISFGNTYNGYINDSNSKDFYKFTLSSSGKVNLKSTAYMKWIYYTIYDANGNRIWYDNPYWDDSTNQISYNESFDLTSGTYYLCVEKDGSYTGNYNFKLLFTSANESFKDENGGSNNSLNTANSISTNVAYNGQIAKNDEKDFYKFTLSTSGRVRFTSTAYMKWIYYTIYDTNGNRIWYANPYWNDSTNQISYDENIDLTSGTYYLCIERDGSYTGNYNFKLSFTSANESFKEGNGGSNNSINTANAISTNTTYKGQIAKNDEKDFYKFTLSKSQTINVTSQADILYVDYAIYDASGKEVWSGDGDSDWSTKTLTLDEKVQLSSGTYYFMVEKYSDSYTGNYTFNIKSESNNNTTSTLKITNANYPTTISEGQSFTLTGTISSNYKITSVTVRVLNSYGNAVSTASKTVYPNAYSYSNIDSGIKFGTLSAGNYTYQVIAKDASGTQKTLVNRSFTVTPVSVLYTGVTTTSINVRKGPSTSYSIIGKLSEGTTVQIVAKDSTTGWYKIKYGSGYGYISYKYIKLTNSTITDTPMTATGVTTSSMNVRKGPSTDYSIIGKLSEGATVQIVAKNNETGWYKIKYGSGYGYISYKYLKIGQTGGEDIQTVQTGVTTGTLNVRSGPSTSYSKIGTLSEGTTVQIVAKDSATGWYKIKYGSDYGYISYKYVKIGQTGGTTQTGVTTGTLNVRSGPSTSYSKIGTLSEGTTVQIVSKDSATGWYKIKYGSGYGYVSYKYIRIN